MLSQSFPNCILQSSPLSPHPSILSQPQTKTLNTNEGKNVRINTMLSSTFSARKWIEEGDIFAQKFSVMATLEISRR